MTVTAQIKLVPSAEQFSLLMATLEAMNLGCNKISSLAYHEQFFDRKTIHHLSYYTVRRAFGLKAQMAVRCIGKVVDAYKVRARRSKGNIDSMRIFRLRGAVPYDCRMLGFDLKNDQLSILTLEGREIMPFQVGGPARAIMQYQKGESDLFYRNGVFYLNVCCQLPEEDLITHQDMIGIDLGICQLATTSEGRSFDGAGVEKVHKKNQKQRAGLQKKGTRAAKRKLKKVSGREKRFKRNENHIISKQIVSEAKRTGSGIAMEDLSGIRERQRVSKRQRARFSGWAFSQLRFFIYYKARLAGVPVFFVPPEYTSQRCHQCGHIEKKNRRSQSEFKCCQCAHRDHADKNAAKNIKLLGCRQSAKGRIAGFMRQ